MVETPQMDFELVAKADTIALHLSDHGKPASTLGATGKLTLLSGGIKTEAALAPAGADKLETKGHFSAAAGTQIVATVNLPGKKPINVHFAIH